MTAVAPLHIDPIEILGSVAGAIVPAPAAPAVTIDVAAAAQAADPVSAECPPLSARELSLLEFARQYAAGAAPMPALRTENRELVRAAVREIDRQIWWRDQAEARAVLLEQRVAEQTRQLIDVRTQRRDLLALLFELVAWCAPRLQCLPSSEAVLARIRAERAR